MEKLMKINNLNFDNLVILLFGFIFFSIIFMAGFSGYLNYLSEKETKDLIKEAISKNMTVEQINNLIK
jgi:hypothetical protein